MRSQRRGDAECDAARAEHDPSRHVPGMKKAPTEPVDAFFRKYLLFAAELSESRLFISPNA